MNNNSSAVTHLSTSQKKEELFRLLNINPQLIVFDNAESIINLKKGSGHFEAYVSFIVDFINTPHKGKLLLTSRDVIPQFQYQTDIGRGFTTLKLNGLLQKDAIHFCAEMIAQKNKDKDGKATGEVIDRLVVFTKGNPLYLINLLSSFIESPRKDINKYLMDTKGLIKDITDILNERLTHISPFEQQILYTLALSMSSLTYEEVKYRITFTHFGAEIISNETIQVLENRNFIIPQSNHTYGLQPVVHEFLIEKLIYIISNEIITQKPEFLYYISLLTIKSSELVRNNQKKDVILPIISNIIFHFGEKKAKEPILKLLKLQTFSATQNNLTGNLLNILAVIQSPVTNIDLQERFISNVNFRDYQFRNINFSDCTFKDCLFIHKFGTVLTMQFHPVTGLLFTGNSRGEVTGLDLIQDKVDFTGPPHRDWVRALAISSDGRHMVTGGGEGKIQVFEILENGNFIQLKMQIEGHKTQIWDIAFHPDNQSFISAGDDKIIKHWLVEDGTCIGCYPGNDASIRTVKFNPFSKNEFISGDANGILKVWNTDTQKLGKLITANKGILRTAIFHPTEKLLATGGEDKMIKLWDTTTWELQSEFKAHDELIWSLAYDKSGKRLVSGSHDNQVRVWNTTDNSPLEFLEGHENWVEAVAFSPDERYLYSSDNDQVIRIWDTQTWECVHMSQGYSVMFWGLDFHPVLPLLASGSSKNNVEIWDLTSKCILYNLVGHTNWVWTVKFLPDGRSLASGSGDRILQIWDFAKAYGINKHNFHAGRVRSLDCSHDGEWIFSGSGSNQKNLFLWHLPSNRIVELIPPKEGWIHAVAFHPTDANLVASAGDHTEIHLWDIAQKKVIRIFSGHSSSIWTISFTPDGRNLVSGGKIARIWNTETGEMIGVLDGHKNRVRALDISPDGRFVLTGSQDETVILWEMETRTQIKKFQNHTSGVRAVKFSPDGQKIATGGEDRRIFLIDLATGGPDIELQLLRPYEGSIFKDSINLEKAIKLAIEDLGGII